MPENKRHLRFTVHARNSASEELNEIYSTDDEMEAKWLASECRKEYSHVEIKDRENTESWTLLETFAEYS